MKKMIVFTLCMSLAFALSGCGSDKEKVEIPNPFTECATLEEAAAIAGFDLIVPDQIEGYTDRQISAIDQELIQVDYTNGNTEDANSDSEISGDEAIGDGNNNDGSENTEAEEDPSLYIRKGAGNEDISGDYNEYSETNTLSVDGLSVTVKGDDGKISVAIWTDGDYSFAIGTGTPMTVDALQTLLAQIK